MERFVYSVRKKGKVSKRIHNLRLGTIESAFLQHSKNKPYELFFHRTLDNVSLV